MFKWWENEDFKNHSWNFVKIEFLCFLLFQIEFLCIILFKWWKGEDFKNLLAIFLKSNKAFLAWILKYSCVFNHDPDELNMAPKYLMLLSCYYILYTSTSRFISTQISTTGLFLSASKFQSQVNCIMGLTHQALFDWRNVLGLLKMAVKKRVMGYQNGSNETTAPDEWYTSRYFTKLAHDIKVQNQ